MKSVSRAYIAYMTRFQGTLRGIASISTYIAYMASDETHFTLSPDGPVEDFSKIYLTKLTHAIEKRLTLMK